MKVAGLTMVRASRQANTLASITRVKRVVPLARVLVSFGKVGGGQ